METDKKEPSWEELLGSNQWEGLLEPLNLSLRKLILRCGDFCQATYDAFNNDENSRFCGSSRYGHHSFFKKVELPSASDYNVVGFLYATAGVEVPHAFLLHSSCDKAWDKESNWIGYIAVTSDEVSKALGRREIYVAWRGTIRTLEWIDVLQPKLVPVKPLLKPAEPQHHWYDAIVGGNKDDEGSSSDGDDGDDVPKVMSGWSTLYYSANPNSPFTKTSARTQLLTKIKELVSLYKDENPSLTLTGHSLGACLAILSAFDVVEDGLTIRVSAFVFGSPQVGNEAFVKKLKSFPNLRILHIKNGIDLIPLYPSALLGFASTGVELVIDSRKSPSLKESKNPSDWHNLQGMLHIVAGWNGKEGEFELKVKRSLALVNKSSDILKDEYLVPSSWWIEKNKGMTLDEDGEWVLAPPDNEDMPDPDF